MNILVWILLAGLLAGGCESLGNPTLQGMIGPGSKMEKWVGKHRDELAKDKEWGPPSEERPSENGVVGGRALVYKRDYVFPGQYSRVVKTCQMVFQADSKGIVRSWSYHGC